MTCNLGWAERGCFLTASEVGGWCLLHGIARLLPRILRGNVLGLLSFLLSGLFSWQPEIDKETVGKVEASDMAELLAVALLLR